MKTQVNILFTKLDKKALDNLTMEVKETVATPEATAQHVTVFSSADLWNIQKMRRVRSSRRYLV
ncbi:MAG: hypothetical protein KGO81_11650 [Bacteroidota bacterium]|nr:hypothetical protein [Bacteroidota bacterium]